MAELELAYAPPYSSAKDPINFAGFIGENILDGKSEVIHSDSIPKESYLVDVRNEDEFVMGTIPGAINIPLGQIRNNLEKFPKDKSIIVFCQMGLRGYLAERILKVNGFKVQNLSGGYAVWKLFNPVKKSPKTEIHILQGENNLKIDKEINACGLQCPGPILKVKEALNKMEQSQLLKVVVNDKGFLNDIPAWCKSTGNELISATKETDCSYVALIRKGENIQIKQTACLSKEKKTSIVLFSNDLDKALAALIIATGFASLGHKVSIFFTFWGLNVLRKDNPPSVKKDILSRMFSFMMPCGAKKLALSKMHMMGMGTGMMKHVMKQKGVATLPELIAQAQGMGVEFLACEMAMNVMGIQEEELIEGIEIAGVANFAALSEQSTTTLFI